MKILITGGTGFIGTHFVDRFLDLGHEVTLLDLWLPDREREGVAFVHGDVRDPAAVRRALRGCDAVLHLAAAHHDFGIEPATFFSVNKGGMKELCDGMSEQGISNLCFYSSVAVYGAEGEHQESETPQPTNHYGASKRAGEEVMAEWVRQDESRSGLVIRPTMTFGPGNFANMHKLIRQIDRGLFFPVGPGQNRKSMAYIENLVDATLHVWPGAHTGWRIFNYGDKPDMTSREIVEGIYKALGKKPPRGHLPLGPVMAAAKVIDRLSALLKRNFAISSQGVQKLAGIQSVFPASRIAEAGFVPTVTLEEGIHAMVEWYREVPKGKGVARIPPPDVQVIA